MAYIKLTARVLDSALREHNHLQDFPATARWALFHELQETNQTVESTKDLDMTWAYARNLSQFNEDNQTECKFLADVHALTHMRMSGGSSFIYHKAF